MQGEALAGKSKSILHFAWGAHPCRKQYRVACLYTNDVPDSLFLLSWVEMIAEHRLHVFTWCCQHLSRTHQNTCSRDPPPPSTNLTDVWIAGVWIKNINDVFWEGGVKDGNVGVSRHLLTFIRRDHSGSVSLWSLWDQTTAVMFHDFSLGSRRFTKPDEKREQFRETTAKRTTITGHFMCKLSGDERFFFR